METTRETAYLSLGSNLGNRHYLLLRAIDLLACRVGRLVRASSFIETEPWGFSSPHPFLNAAVCLQTSLTPHQLLAETQAIERHLGRTAKTQPATLGITFTATLGITITTASSATVPDASASGTPALPLPIYHDRPIDIDILLYGHLRLSTPDLTIPHPLMHLRDFVLRPLREIMPADELEQVLCQCNCSR